MQLDAAAFLIVFSFATFATVTVVSRRSDKRLWTAIAVTFGTALLSCLAVSLAVRGRNSVVQLGLLLLEGDRTSLALILAAGFAGAVSGIGICCWQETRQRAIGVLLLYHGAILGFCLLVLKEAISPFLADLNASGSKTWIESDVVDGYMVEKIADLSIRPTSLVIGPDGSVFIAGYAGLAMQNGSIVRVNISDGTTVKVASYLTRPHGLAFWQGDLFVSRAGQFNRAVNGQIVVEATGAVTRLRDLDGDGVFDFYEDVVTDLPGAQNPDGLHQNNGIVFDADGNLFITVGAPSDHSPSPHPYAGTIATCRPDGSGLRVFARGLRNPYDLTFGPGGALYCTDNDANNRSTGDELNLIEEGKHYGFHYQSVPGIEIDGSVAPILTCSHAQGLAYAPRGTLVGINEESLLVAAHGDNHINRVAIDENGGKAKLEFFATIPYVVDVALAEDGAIYACSHTELALYRIRPKGRK